eukprot:CAMPEP_0115082830 /NCGR_PEP_ID=MMETSP0227-20121206/20153_1 /TAXON_ID=89957 /ORGANISM="Polarella glacialis, Strain CCMP 1383" /LENGTH=172 /DNA_ID=CAMNT_0002471031 /DNA_START=281 /DNA_END=800 /DNA_ORIENTATION=-
MMHTRPIPQLPPRAVGSSAFRFLNGDAFGVETPRLALAELETLETDLAHGPHHEARECCDEAEPANDNAALAAIAEATEERRDHQEQRVAHVGYRRQAERDVVLEHDDVNAHPQRPEDEGGPEVRHDDGIEGEESPPREVAVCLQKIAMDKLQAGVHKLLHEVDDPDRHGGE